MAAATPKSWTAENGAANLSQSATSWQGSGSLQITGDAGGTLTKLSIQLDGIDGAIYRPNRKYMMAVRLQRSFSLSAGEIKFAVQDGSSIDQDGSAATFDLTAVSNTAFDLRTFSWSSGPVTPVNPKYIIGLTTAIPNTESVLVDELVLTEMTQLSGNRQEPYVAGLRGDVDAKIEDKYTVQVVNTNNAKFVSLFDRWWNVHSLGNDYQVPIVTDGSETQPDLKVT